MLSLKLRSSTASRLISPNISPDRENPSALRGTPPPATLNAGSLLDLECVRYDDPEVGLERSDFALSNVSPIAKSCPLARLSENSAATERV
jgi:hypothetical protein